MSATIEHIKESEELWQLMSNEADPERVSMLVGAMNEQFGLIMAEETNADVHIALMEFLSYHLMHMVDDSQISIPGATMLFQLGVCRGVAAHVKMREEDETKTSTDGH
jgi:hypothetical protein